MSEAKQKIIKDLKWLIQNNDFERSGLETSKINRVLGGILSTPGDAGIEGLDGLYGTELANAGANLESRILGGLRVLPGDNVHHIVPLGLLRDALKDHPLHIQEEVLKRVEDEFGIQTGNSKRNLESILEFTHVFAGDKAAHPDGDTVQRYLRPTVLPPGSSSKDIFDSIKQSLTTAIEQYKNAVAPGTVEAARRQNVVDKFTNVFGIKLDPFKLEAEDLKGVTNALKIARTEAPNLDTNAFSKFVQNGFLQELANDPLGQRFAEVDRDQYSRFNDFLTRRAVQLETGFKRGFRDLQPAAPPFGPREESRGFKNSLSTWLTTNGLEPTRANTSLARKALQSEFNSHLLKIQNSGHATPDLFTAPADLMIRNKSGAFLGSVADREVGKLAGQGKYLQAAGKGFLNGFIGAGGQQLLKSGLQIAAKKAPAAAARLAAGTAASGPFFQVAGPVLAAAGAMDVVDGFIEGATGKPFIRHISDPINANIQQQNAQLRERLAAKQRAAAGTAKLMPSKVAQASQALSTIYPSVKPQQVTPKVVAAKPKPQQQFKPINDLMYLGKQVSKNFNKLIAGIIRD